MGYVERRVVDTFNALFNEHLPPPDAEHAVVYWYDDGDMKVPGRCVNLGMDDSVTQVRHYHRGICRNEKGDLAVQEFWHPEIWTTDLYRATNGGLPTSDRPRATFVEPMDCPESCHLHLPLTDAVGVQCTAQNTDGRMGRSPLREATLIDIFQ